jgi:hypothetical protein
MNSASVLRAKAAENLGHQISAAEIHLDRSRRQQFSVTFWRGFSLDGSLLTK